MSLALSLVCVPAAAQASERRSALSVTAVVQPACHVGAEAVRCSPDMRWTSVSTARRTARPLDAAASVLGEPLRRDGRIVLSAPAVEITEAAGGEPSYRTITY